MFHRNWVLKGEEYYNKKVKRFTHSEEKHWSEEYYNRQRTLCRACQTTGTCEERHRNAIVLGVFFLKWGSNVGSD